MYEMYRCRRRGFNWVECLQDIVNSINKQPKEVLSYQTPFAVYFGRGYDKSADEIKKNAKRASIKCNKRLNESQMKRRPCYVSEKGAHIFLRYPFGKRVPYKRYILKGKVLQRSGGFSRYRVLYTKQDDSVVTEWVSVEHITSRTSE
ncbi:hypothetical protein DPMN_089221 [Dreissena polymorpha]|uniref:Uncharacterized protein n=1 Tax=Dreissena polymorpha TaxID=45954 RepID=A0A9D4QX86_DREPO|nr:hypothetical protein DPMN_089221 [Dreissena polymorpha]